MSFEDLWNGRRKPTVSFELFPQRDKRKVEKLNQRIEKFVLLKPDFIAVTFGAGGSSRDGSLKLVRRLKGIKGIMVLPYFAGYGLGPEEIKRILSLYKAEGIESVLCVRGDEPEGLEDFKKDPDSFEHADSIINFVKNKFDFTIGTAGYPEGHKEAVSFDEDINHLKNKIKYGAKYIITQYFFDNNYFYKFRDKCRSEGIKVPIVAGIMPIYNVKVLKNLSELCGATITPALNEGLNNINPKDQQELHDFGVGFAVGQCTDLIKNNVDGIHFYTMDRVKSARDILSELRGTVL